MGAARHLAVAFRTRQDLLRWRAGIAGARPALAGTEVRSRSKKQHMIALQSKRQSRLQVLVTPFISRRIAIPPAQRAFDRIDVQWWEFWK